MSPYKYPPGIPQPPPTWADVMPQIAQRVHWTEPSFVFDVFFAEQLAGGEEDKDTFKRRGAFLRQAEQADMIIFLDISDGAVASWLARHTRAIATGVAFGCGATLTSQNRLLFQPALPLLGEAALLIPWSQASRDARLLATAQSLYERYTPSDFVYMILSLVDAAVAPVRTLSVNKKTTLANIACMVRNCAGEIKDCVTDPQCNAALKCLEECGLNDQVCAYRCIVSYESPKFEAFTLCNLLKHNCLGNKAETPTLPVVKPMTAWRGEPLTHEVAEQLFIGWLDVAQRPTLPAGGEPLKWSWKVVCGQNPAYDFFPCQHQIFYHTKNGKSFWYDPVFRVLKLDGTPVWRRRHYRVRRGRTPGTFTFSVLDNGVTSLEYWRVVDVAEDLSWGLFYYSGCAEAAGQAYSGAVFVSPDGAWPPAEQMARVEAAHAACGIAMWELSEVDNSCCDGAPLELEV